MLINETPASFREFSKHESCQAIIKYFQEQIDKKTLLDIITNSFENFVDYVIFTDALDRGSKEFKFLIKLHIELKDESEDYNQLFQELMTLHRYKNRNRKRTKIFIIASEVIAKYALTNEIKLNIL